jgi:prolyl-tRNA synthetase
MRVSSLHIPTVKEAPKEAEIPSHALLLRAGYIRKQAAGIYSYLPLSMRTLHKITAIVREELNRAGAQEILMPTIQPAELWKESGRWEQYGPELLRIQDRKGGDFCYAPTAEEVIVDLVRRDVKSYRQLPLNLYQIGTKFRDELRPRAGLMRGREFTMKDAYSFDVDDEAAGRSYDAMYDAYHRIFERCGLAFRPVEADTGAIGGSRSHEFQVLADTGEDSIVSCGQCGYTANVEKAELRRPNQSEGLGNNGEAELQTIETPGKRTVEDVAAFLGVKKKKVVKTLIFVADGSPVAALIRGDHELNDLKLKQALNVTLLEMAGEELVRELTGAPVGFAGPVELAAKGVRIVADDSLRGIADFVVGANAADKHHTGVNLERDLSLSETYDLRTAGNRDGCGRCNGKFQFFRGIEVGHVFFLGTKYSEPMGCVYLDDQGQERPMVMGCYGIGITRIMAAAIEQNHDADGIQWPLPIAPYEVHVLALNQDDEEVIDAAAAIYDELIAAGVEAVLDDRPMRPGAKFKDADLIGFPYQVVVGRRGLADGVAEVKRRADGERSSIPLAEIAANVVERVVAERRPSND